MKGLLFRATVSAIALYLTYVLAKAWNIGIILEPGWQPLVYTIAMLAMVNAVIKPLVLLLTVPLSCLTLGGFSLIINALMFWLVGSGWMPGFRVEGFLPALFGSVVMSVITGLANNITGMKE